MQQIRSRVPAGWLLAVPVLTGAAGGAAPLAVDLTLLAAALLTSGVLAKYAKLVGSAAQGAICG